MEMTHINSAQNYSDESNHTAAPITRWPRDAVLSCAGGGGGVKEQNYSDSSTNDTMRYSRFR